MSGLKPLGSQTRFITMHPYGVPVDPHQTSTRACYPNYENPANVCKPDVRLVGDPPAGRLGDRGRGAPHLAACSTIRTS